MKFEWDERKRILNLAKHDLDFLEALLVFESNFKLNLDLRKEYGEDRWQALGHIYGHIVVVIFTEPGDDIVRIISARRATRDEKAEYYRHIRS